MKVSIYTTNTCAYCKQVKKYLKGKGVSYKEINLSEHPEEAAEAFRLSGAMTVPVTLVEKGEDKKVIVGFNLGKLAPAIS